MFTLPIIVAFLLGMAAMVVLTVAIITLGEVFESKERTKRVKAEIAAQQEKDYRNRMEFASHNEKKEIVKQALAEHDRMKINNSMGSGVLGLSGSPSSSSPVEMMQEAQDNNDKNFERAVRSGHPNPHQFGQQRFEQSDSSDMKIMSIHIPDEIINDIVKTENAKSSAKGKRKSVRKTATKKTSRKPQAKKARSRKTS